MNVKKFKAIIIDDESSARDVLSGMISQYFDNISVIAEASSFETAVDVLLNIDADLVFMDISLGAHSAFDVLDAISQTKVVNPIFVTAFDDFAVKSFKYNAFDYLVKPIGLLDFKTAVLKRLSYLNSHKAVSNNEVSSKYLSVSDKNSVFFLKLCDVLYLNAMGSYTKIFTLTGNEFVTSKSLGYYEQVLSEHAFFVRVHKSYIVNIMSVQSYNKSDKLLLLLNNEQIPVTISVEQLMSKLAI